jgi:hypothetical protein
MCPNMCDTYSVPTEMLVYEADRECVLMRAGSPEGFGEAAPDTRVAGVCCDRAAHAYSHIHCALSCNF